MARFAALWPHRRGRPKGRPACNVMYTLYMTGSDSDAAFRRDRLMIVLRPSAIRHKFRLSHDSRRYARWASPTISHTGDVNEHRSPQFIGPSANCDRWPANNVFFERRSTAIRIFGFLISYHEYPVLFVEHDGQVIVRVNDVRQEVFVTDGLEFIHEFEGWTQLFQASLFLLPICRP